MKLNIKITKRYNAGSGLVLRNHALEILKNDHLIISTEPSFLPT